MKQYIFPILLIAPSAAFADGDDSITKVQFRIIDASGNSNPMAGKLQVLYRSGTEKGRLEKYATDKPAPSGAMIVDREQVWTINFAKKIGKHFTDPGPEFGPYVPIAPMKRNETPIYRNFQVGLEREFMRDHQVHPQKGEFEGSPCTLYEFTDQNYVLRLFCKPATDVPIGAEVTLGNQVLTRLHYDSFQRHLPLDDSLFRPPSDIEITDQPN